MTLMSFGGAGDFETVMLFVHRIPVGGASTHFGLWRGGWAEAHKFANVINYFTDSNVRVFNPRCFTVNKSK